MDTGGACSSSASLFGQGTGNVAELVTVGAETILREQVEAINENVEHGGENIYVHWELDATPMYMELQDPETVAALAREDVRDEEESRRGSREVVRCRATGSGWWLGAGSSCRATIPESVTRYLAKVLVQRGFVVMDAVDEEVFSAPLILGDESSATHLDAMLSRMQRAGLDLEKLSANFKHVTINFGIDGASTMQLVVDFADWLCSTLGNVTVMANDACLMHSLNRIVADHIQYGRFKLNGVFGASKLLHLGNYSSKVAKAVSVGLITDPEWHQVGGPPVEEMTLHKRFVDLAMPNLAQEPKKERLVSEGLRDCNGKWSQVRAVHHCRPDPLSGEPCCRSINEVKRKLRDGGSKLLMSWLPPIPCVSRWLTVVSTLGWFAMGIVFHCLGPRSWLHAFSTEKFETAPDSDTNKDDSFPVKVGKRMKKSYAMFSSSSFDLLLLFTLTLLCPFQLVMGTLMFTSKGVADIPVRPIVVSINNCTRELIDLLTADISDRSGKWFALHASCRVAMGDVTNQQHRRAMRKETLRALGGVFMRTFPQFKRRDTQCWLVIEQTDDEDEIKEARDRCRPQSPCCATASTLTYFNHIRTSSVAQLKKMKKIWNPYIIKTEADHGGNRKRGCKRQFKHRSWRRQSSTYVCARAKQRFQNISKQNALAAKRLCTIPLALLRRRVARCRRARSQDGRYCYYYYY